MQTKRKKDKCWGGGVVNKTIVPELNASKIRKKATKKENKLQI